MFVSISQVIGCEDRLRNDLGYTVSSGALNSTPTNRCADERSCEHFWLAGSRVETSSLSPFVWRPSATPACDCDAAMGFSNWAPGQPDNAGDASRVREACAAMGNGTSGRWYDVACSERTCAICELRDYDVDAVVTTATNSTD